MAVKFYLNPNPDKRGEHPIRISISIKGTRVVSTVGYNVDPSRWDSDKQQVKPKTTTAAGYTDKDINARIKYLIGQFGAIESAPGPRPTPGELQDKLAELKGSTRKRTRREDSAPVELTILDHFDNFVKTESNRIVKPWTAGTRQCWAAFRKHLQNLGATDFEYFNEEGRENFVRYLRAADESIGKREMDEKTVKKHYSNLLWFLKWCIKKGIWKDGNLGDYKIDFEEGDKPVVFLDEDELIQLYKYEIPANGTRVELTDSQGETYTKTVHDAGALAKTRDLFCFCAMTSLRYSDAAKLKRSDIVDGKMHVVAKKTKKPLNIELNRHAQAILDKYADTPIPGDLALPIISNQKANDYIKDLGELCGFNTPVKKTCYRGGKLVEESYPKWQLLSTHAARRTFVCHAISIGIPAQVVMRWTGHSSLAAMKPYIEIAEKKKKEAMEFFDSSLNI